MPKLKSRNIQNQDQRIGFFDALAENYSDTHDPEGKQFQYRLCLLKELIIEQRGTLLEIGCGTGIHLLALADSFQNAIGIDFSSRMIAAAKAQLIDHPQQEQITFSVDFAETLSTIENQTIDVLFCIGAFEHMPNKSKVLQQVFRVLKEDGIFICLTPNADYIWYTSLSRWLKIDTRHLLSDSFINADEFISLSNQTDLVIEHIGFWRFIPKGDIPSWVYPVLMALDAIGKIFHLPKLQGGLLLKVVKKTST